jgi:hypothetical protein
LLNCKLKDAQKVFADVTDHLLAIKETGDREKFQADASLYLEMAGVLFVAWQWLLQAMVAFKALPTAIDVDKNFYQGKLVTCQYFFKYELPKLESLAKTLKSSDGLTVAIDAALFED